MLESQFLRYVTKEVRPTQNVRKSFQIEPVPEMSLTFSPGCRGDGFICGRSAGRGSGHFGGNVSEPAAGVYQAYGLHLQQSVQETL